MPRTERNQYLFFTTGSIFDSVCYLLNFTILELLKSKREKYTCQSATSRVNTYFELLYGSQRASNTARLLKAKKKDQPKSLSVLTTNPKQQIFNYFILYKYNPVPVSRKNTINLFCVCFQESFHYNLRKLKVHIFNYAFIMNADSFFSFIN